MQIQIDQSIKIEQTNRDTIIAFSNSKSFAIVISAKAKKQIKQEFRLQGKRHLFYYRTFAAGIVLLIKDYLSKIDVVIIDREYSGRELLIKNMILEMLKNLDCKQPTIYFKGIGRKSNAHKVAYLTMKNKRKADKILKLSELVNLIFKTK